MSTSTFTLNVVGALAIGALALYVLLPGMQDALHGSQAPYRVIRPSATVAGETVVETYQQPPPAQTNGYGLVTNGPDPVQNKINDALTRCLEGYGTPKYHPTHRITTDEFLTVTTCVNSTLGRNSQ